MHLLSVFSLRNRALIALVTIAVGIFGGISLTTLKQELIPSLTFPRLFIITAYPGASPAVVEQDGAVTDRGGHSEQRDPAASRAEQAPQISARDQTRRRR